MLPDEPGQDPQTPETTDPPTSETTTDPPAAATEPSGEPAGEPAEPDVAAPDATTEPAPDTAEPPEGDDKRSAAARRGHQTRAEKAKQRAELAKNADVKKLVDEAIERGRVAAKTEADEAAKRASMSDLEKTQAERDDAVRKVEEMQTQLDAAQLEREYATALVDSGARVRAKARGVVRTLVAEAMSNDPNLSANDALTYVINENDYLLDSEPPAAPPAAATSTRRGSTTAPTPKRDTAAPAEPVGQKPVDVMKMTKKEYAEYIQAKHGIH